MSLFFLQGDLVLPLFPGEILWSNSFRAVIYMLALIYFFFGIAIIADIFMAAIEQITSKAKRVAIAPQMRFLQGHVLGLRPVQPGSAQPKSGELSSGSGELSAEG